VILSDATPDWPEAADRYWSVLSEMPGAPSGLRIVDLGSGEERAHGDGRAYEIHGSSEALLEVLSGRAPLIDAAFEGKVFIRGTFAELSVLTGACFAIADAAADDDE
jgi:hypothetical protein